MLRIETEKHNYFIDCTEEEITKALDTEDNWIRITTDNDKKYIINKDKIERITL